MTRINLLHKKSNWEEFKLWFDDYKPILLFFVFVIIMGALMFLGGQHRDRLEGNKHLCYENGFPKYEDGYCFKRENGNDIVISVEKLKNDNEY